MTTVAEVTGQTQPDYHMYSNCSDIGPCAECNTITHLQWRDMSKNYDKIVHVCIDCALAPSEEVPMQY